MTIPLIEHDEIASALGEPQIVKGIPFYPIKLLDKKTLNIFNYVFSYSRSNMYFLLGEKILERKVKYPWLNIYLSKYQEKINPDGIENIIYLTKLLSYICKIDDKYITVGCEDSSYNYDCKTCIDKDITIQFTIYETQENGTKTKRFVKFSNKEFDSLRAMLIEQNGRNVDYIDEWNDSFEKSLKKFMKSQQNQFSRQASLSDDIITYKELSKKSDEEFKSMTLYQFAKGYEKAKQIADYKIFYPLMIDGKIKIKNGLPHYSIPNEKHGRYSMILSDYDKIKKEKGGIGELLK